MRKAIQNRTTLAVLADQLGPSNSPRTLLKSRPDRPSMDGWQKMPHDAHTVQASEQSTHIYTASLSLCKPRDDSSLHGCLTYIPRQPTAGRSSSRTPSQRDPQVAKHRTLLLEPPRVESSGPRRARGPREEAGRGVTVAPPPASDGTLSNLPAALADLRRIDELISRRHIDNQMRIWV